MQADEGGRGGGGAGGGRGVLSVHHAHTHAHAHLHSPEAEARHEAQRLSDLRQGAGRGRAGANLVVYAEHKHVHWYTAHVSSSCKQLACTTYIQTFQENECLGGGRRRPTFCGASSSALYCSLARASPLYAATVLI